MKIILRPGVMYGMGVMTTRQINSASYVIRTISLRSIPLICILIIVTVASGQSKIELRADATESPALTFSESANNWSDYVVSGDGRAVAVSSSTTGTTQVIDYASQRTIATVPLVGKLAFAGHGDTLLVGAPTGRLLWWNAYASSSQSKQALAPTRVAALEMTTDAQVAIVGLSDGSIDSLDRTTNQLRKIGDVKTEVKSVDISGDQRWLLVTYGMGALSSPEEHDGGSAIYDLKSGRRMVSLDKTPGYGVLIGRLSPDGRTAYTVRDMSPGISVWDVKSGSNIGVLLKDSTISCFALASDGSRLVARDDFGNVTMVEVSTGKVVWSQALAQELPPIEKLLIPPNSGTVLACPQSADPVVLSIVDGSIKGTLTLQMPRPVALRSVQLTQDGKRLSGGSQNFRGLWALDTGQMLANVSWRLATNERLAVSIPMMNYSDAVNVGDKGVCKLNTLAFAPRGKTFAVGTCFSSFIVIMQPPSEVPQFIPSSDDGASGTIMDLRFSPSGRYVAAYIASRLSKEHQRIGSALALYDLQTAKTAAFVDVGNRDIIQYGLNNDETRLWIASVPDGLHESEGAPSIRLSMLELPAGNIVGDRSFPCANCFDFYASTARMFTVSPNAEYVVFQDEQQRCSIWKSEALEPDTLLDDATLGGISIVAFSKDGKLLAYGNRRVLRVVNTADNKNRAVVDIANVLGFQPRQMAAWVSIDDARIYLDADGRLFDVFLAQPQGPGVEIKQIRGQVNDFAQDIRGDVAAATSVGLELLSPRSDSSMASLMFLDDGTSAVISSDSRFDADDIERLRAASWRMPDDLMRPLPLEIFMRDYYEPNLLTRLLGCKQAEGAGLDQKACERTFPPVRPLASLNRIQPEIKIVGVRRGATADEAVVEVEARGKTDLSEPNGKITTAAFDLRLFRDGQLVGQWPEPKGSMSGPADVEAWRKVSPVPTPRHNFPVKLASGDPSKPVKFTAYAFNEDRVKSETTAPWLYTPPADMPKRKSKAYVITVGIDGYENERWDLEFAAKDAQDMSNALRHIKDYEVVPVTLVSEAPLSAGSLNQATKAKIHAVLELLGGHREHLAFLAGVAHVGELAKATPDDLVILSFSGHGYTKRDGAFYLLPSDADPDKDIPPTSLPSFISSEELSEWLRDVDAGQMAMIIDACHSAASVDIPGFKPGPMGDRGLGQLAYDKGMRILAASQADDIALEIENLHQGLLTYALVQEGLRPGEDGKLPADLSGNGQVTLEEWLKYGEQRTPSLYEDIRNGKIKAVAYQTNPDSTAKSRDPKPNPAFLDQVLQHAQTPSLFDFHKENKEVMLTKNNEK